jgi:hypothetical protein
MMPTGAVGPLARRREHALARIGAGGELSAEERRRISDLLARLGRDPAATDDDLAEIEYAIQHYWHLMALTIEDVAARLDQAARLAAALAQVLAGLPHHILDMIAESDPEWGLVWVGVLPPELRRQRPVRFEGEAGSRVELAQHVVEHAETWAVQARRRMPPTPRGKRVQRELRWLLSGLRRIWTERLGMPFRVRREKRDSIAELVAVVVEIADPYVPHATASGVLRGMSGRRPRRQ